MCQLNVSITTAEAKIGGSHTAALAPVVSISLATSSNESLRKLVVNLEWSSLNKGIVEASYRSARHCPSCRRVADVAVAVRYQIAVDPWPIQNEGDGAGSR